MPSYCYSNDERQETIERMFSMKGDIPKTVEHNGAVYTRDLAAEHGNIRIKPGIWPMESWGAGVPVHQIGEATTTLNRAGVHTEFTADGRAIFRDRKHRSQHFQAMGYIDRDGGYSDNTRTKGASS